MENVIIEKKCSKCKEIKNVSEFSKDKYIKDGYTCRCKKCRNEHYNSYYEKYPEKAKLKNDEQKDNRFKFYNSDVGIESSRRAHLKRMFNITLEKYNIMLAEHNGVCAICGEPEVYYRNKVLCVDHDHKTDKIRGLLCNRCNRSLGLLKDDKNLLISAINYLTKYE